MPKRHSQRRTVAKLRASLLAGGPMAIMPSAMAGIMESLAAGNADELEAVLNLSRSDSDQPETIDGIRLIRIGGVLQEKNDIWAKLGYACSYSHLEQQLNNALADSQVSGIMLFADSPGGSAIGCKRIADQVHAATKQKPVHAYSQGLCGSACYYIAAAATSICATADAMIGSVGTIYTHVSMQKMLEEYGYDVTVITNSGSPKKGHGNSYEDLTEESRKTLESFVESYGKGFIADVMRYRTAQNVTLADHGWGNVFRADAAVQRGLADEVVGSLSEAVSACFNRSTPTTLAAAVDFHSESADAEVNNEDETVKITAKLRAFLFAMGFVQASDASDEVCESTVRSFFRARGEECPEDETSIIAGMNSQPASAAAEQTTDGTETQSDTGAGDAHQTEMQEARLQELRASAQALNTAAGSTVVTDTMVLDSLAENHNITQAMEAWASNAADDEPPARTGRAVVTGEGATRYAADAIAALTARADDGSFDELSEDAQQLASKPLWAIAGEALQLAGHHVDMYGNPQLIAEEAMAMGTPGQRHAFYSDSEDRRYVQASGIPYSRPGDFPNILSGLANRYLDMIELDDDYSFTDVSALLPQTLKDFKPSLMVNKGVVEELDELEDAEALKELGMEEEVLSYIFLKRFGNKFGWTPVMIANDDIGAFAEGMLGLREAWEVSQNRLVLDRFTSGEQLLDGNALFADRTNTGSGANPATNNNLISSGGAPSDTQWSAMEELYADIGGIKTGRRVRGVLNTLLVPSGNAYNAAIQHFAPLNQLAEGKLPNTTDNIGIRRGKIKLIPESELRTISKNAFYGLRNPTRLNTATVVRGYFSGYGRQGRRERWYDPERKTTWISLEGRMAAAAKNWRYAVKNPGE